MSETEDKLGFRLFEENGQWWAQYQSAPNLPVAASQREVSLWRELTEQRGDTAESAREFAMAIPATDPLYICLIRLIESGSLKNACTFAEAYASSRLAAWRCFFCNEIFTDEAEAKEHFGSDEYELCAPPGCIDPLRTDEKARLKELHQAEAHAMKMQQEAEENDEAKGLLEIYRAEIGRYFGIVGGVTASTPHQAWLVLEAEQGKVSAAESRLAEVTAQQEREHQELEDLRASARNGLLKFTIAGDVGCFADKMRQLLQGQKLDELNRAVTDFFNYAKDQTERGYEEIRIWMERAEAASSRLAQQQQNLYQAYLLGCEDECIPEPKTFEKFMETWRGE